MNGILDESTNQLPTAPELDPEQLAQEKRMAKFAKSQEFKMLKEFLEERINFYQKYLPDGRSVTETLPTPEQWSVANGIIGEFNLIINSFEQAAEAVDATNG